MPPFVRTIVKLTEERVKALKAHANPSEGERRALVACARGLTGRFHSGFPDVAENHDQHLDEAYDWCDKRV